MTAAASEDEQGAGERRSLRLIHTLPVVPLFLLALLAARPIRDNSFLWHIRSGALQIADERVISSDPFSFTMLGEPWRTQSWLLEIQYAYLEQWSGSLVWTNVFVFAVGAVTALLIGAAIYRETPSPISTSVAMIATIWLAGPFLQPRPVLVSYLLFAALVVVLQNRERALWLVIPIIWIWAAVHGSWVLGGGLIVLEWLRTADRRVLMAGTGALATTFLTAHGIGVWLILWDFVGAQDALALMEEWRVPDFGDVIQAPYLLLLVGVIVAGMRSKLKPRDLIVVLPFLFFGMTSRRAVFPAAIVVTPWAAMALPPLRVPRSSMSQGVVTGVFAVLVLVTLAPLALQPAGVLDDERFPSEEIQSAIAGRRLFHDDGVGGFLIYDEWPERLVYLDDRAELYGVDMLTEYTEARQGRYEDVFDRYGFDTALSRVDWPLTETLDADGWTRLAEDDVFIVFVSPGS